MAFLTEDRRAEGLMMEAPIDRQHRPALAAALCAAGLRRLLERTRLGDARRADRRARSRSTPRDIARTLVKNLSGGNQQKVVIGKWLLREPRLFILDEPTRGIDVGAKYEVYKIINRLAAEGAGILMISSEIEELIGMCDRIMVMGHGEIRGDVRARPASTARRSCAPPCGTASGGAAHERAIRARLTLLAAAERAAAPVRGADRRLRPAVGPLPDAGQLRQHRHPGRATSPSSRSA